VPVFKFSLRTSPHSSGGYLPGDYLWGVISGGYLQGVCPEIKTSRGEAWRSWHSTNADSILYVSYSTAKLSPFGSVPLKPGTHGRQSRPTVAKTGDKSPTKLTVDFVADLSPVCRKSTVAGSFDSVDRVAVDIVVTVQHVQLG